MAKPAPVTYYRITEHAYLQMVRRGISEIDVRRVLSAPEQSEVVRVGRKVYQSRVEYGKPPKTYLLRIFVDIDRQPPEVVTVYRTSKMKKYWRIDP